MIKTSPATPVAKFPLAYEAVNTCLGLIVLFTAERVGIVLQEASEGGRAYPLGKYNDTWRSCCDTYHWKPIDITISH